MFAFDKVVGSFKARSNKLLLFIFFNENKERTLYFFSFLCIPSLFFVDQVFLHINY